MTNKRISIKTALAAGRARLAACPDCNAALDAEVLLAATLQQDRTWLYAWSDHPLTETQSCRFWDLLKRRSVGIPIAHLTGHREFWAMDLLITPDTLIPRPDTETLVEQSLIIALAGEAPRILDLGTGSGAVALALARERPNWRIVATDKSAAALEIAQKNAYRLNLTNITFVLCDWFRPFAPSDPFDLVISNPPYIAESDPHLTRGDVRYEPLPALTAGLDGLDALRKIIRGAPVYLKDDAWLLVEHGSYQGNSVRALFDAAGFADIRTFSDLGERERVTSGQNRKRKTLTF